jgi:hypothetical protein
MVALASNGFYRHVMALFPSTVTKSFLAPSPLTGAAEIPGDAAGAGAAGLLETPALFPL